MANWIRNCRTPLSRGGDKRKVVVATNVAETSLTIDGVRLVIDGGLAPRIARYDANRGINTLLIERISQSSADQRAGARGAHGAGRLHAIMVARGAFASCRRRNCRRSKRLDLAEVVLTLKAPPA